MNPPALITQSLINSLKPGSKEYAIKDGQSPGLMIRVQPSGAMSWVLRHKVESKWRRVTLGSVEDLSIIEARAKAFAETVDRDVLTQTENPNAIRFSKLVAEFMAAKDGVYKASTLYCLQTYLDSQLLPAFGDTPINKLTTPDIAKWFYQYSETRPGGANQCIGHLTTMLTFAREAGHLPENAPNPCAPIRRNKRRARGRMLTSQQLRSLGKVLDKALFKRRGAADAIRLILLTGCRSGEILRLTWGEVKRDRLSLLTTKTGARDVLLSPEAKALLKERKKRGLRKYVFPHPRRRGEPMRCIDTHWKHFKELADLPPTTRLHDLRHTYASHAIMSGETLSMTGKLLGHKRQSSTEIYAHLDDGHLSRAAEKVAKKVMGLLDG
jgi:integrase